MSDVSEAKWKDIYYAAYAGPVGARAKQLLDSIGYLFGSPVEAQFFGDFLSWIDVQSGTPLDPSSDPSVPRDTWSTSWTAWAMDLAGEKHAGIKFHIIDKLINYFWFVCPQMILKVGALTPRVDFACHLFKIKKGDGVQKRLGPLSRVVFEIDGYTYHENEKAFLKDRQRDRALQSACYDVFRYTAQEVRSSVPGVGYKALFALLNKTFQIRHLNLIRIPE